MQNRFMGFHADFWVVVGTAAPVIALSCVVSTNDNIRRLYAAPRTKSFRSTLKWKLEMLTYFTNVTNLGLQLVTMGYALVSLAIDRNKMSPALAVKNEVLGLTLLIMSTVLNGLLGAAHQGSASSNDTHEKGE